MHRLCLINDKLGIGHRMQTKFEQEKLRLEEGSCNVERRSRQCRASQLPPYSGWLCSTPLLYLSQGALIRVLACALTTCCGIKSPTTWGSSGVDSTRVRYYTGMRYIGSFLLLCLATSFNPSYAAAGRPRSSLCQVSRAGLSAGFTADGCVLCSTSGFQKHSGAYPGTRRSCCRAP